MFGDFDTDGYGSGLWIVFVLSTTFIPLIMLNLLIAIMSDTFERVVSDLAHNDAVELNGLILEYEGLMFWKRNNGQPQYLHWAMYADEDEAGNEWEGKVKAITSRFSDTDNYILKTSNDLKERIVQNEQQQ